MGFILVDIFLLEVYSWVCSIKYIENIKNTRQLYIKYGAVKCRPKLVCNFLSIVFSGNGNCGNILRQNVEILVLSRFNLFSLYTKIILRTIKVVHIYETIELDIILYIKLFCRVVSKIFNTFLGKCYSMLNLQSSKVTKQSCKKYFLLKFLFYFKLCYFCVLKYSIHRIFAKNLKINLLQHDLLSTL